MRGTTWIASVALAAALALVCCASAGASYVSIGKIDTNGVLKDDLVVGEGFSAEVNHVTITETASGFTVEDTAAVLHAEDGCTAVDDHTATCDRAERLSAHLGEKDDEITLNLRAGGAFDVPDEGLHFPPEVDGGPGADTIRGSAFMDDISGGGGGDTILAGGGPDWVYAGTGEDHVDGGVGDDHIATVGSGEVVDGSWTEVDDPPGEADTFAGGPGADELTYSRRHEALNLTADGVADDGAAGEGDDIAPDVEALWGGPLDDHIELGPGGGGDSHGGGGADTIVGGAGPDQISGDDGDDHLIGGPGADSLIGSEGDDTLDGGPDPDGLMGENGADVIEARDGSTYLPIGPADDWIFCGLGPDTLYADFSEFNRAIPGEGGDGCDVIHHPGDPAHAIDPADSAAAGSEKVTLELECPPSAKASCGGDLRLTAPPPAVAAAKTKKPLVLAQGGVAVRLGRHRTVKLKLTKKGRAYFKAHRKVSARALARSKYTSFKRLRGTVKIRAKSG